MHWTEDGKIEVSRNFALGTAGGLVVLALLLMLLIGMLISGNGDAETSAEVDPTPRVMASERETIRPTTKPQNIDRQEDTEPLAGTKRGYSTCLVRTQKSLLLDIEDAQFTPWATRDDSQSVWEVIQYRYSDYIGDHCQSIAPAPPSTYSETCIPRELQSFYRRHVSEGSSSEKLWPMAAEYALTVCQPSAER